MQHKQAAAAAGGKANRFRHSEDEREDEPQAGSYRRGAVAGGEVAHREEAIGVEVLEQLGNSCWEDAAHAEKEREREGVKEGGRESPGEREGERERERGR